MQTSKTRKIQSITIRDPVPISLKNQISKNQYQYIQTGLNPQKTKTNLARFRESSLKNNNNSRLQTANTSMVSKSKNSSSLHSTNKSMNKPFNSKKKLSCDFTPLPSTPEKNPHLLEKKNCIDCRVRSVKMQRRHEFTEKLDEKNRRLFKIIYIQRCWRYYYYSKVNSAAVLIQKVYFGYLFRKCFIYVKTFNMQLNILVDTLNKRYVKCSYEKMIDQMKQWNTLPSSQRLLSNAVNVNVNVSVGAVAGSKASLTLGKSKSTSNGLVEHNVKKGETRQATPIVAKKIKFINSNKNSIKKLDMSDNLNDYNRSNNNHNNHNNNNHDCTGSDLQTKTKSYIYTEPSNNNNKNKALTQSDLFKVKFFTFYMNQQLYQGLLKFAFDKIKQKKKTKKIIIKPLDLDISRNLNDTKHFSSVVTVNNELGSEDYKRMKILNKNQRHMHFLNEKQQSDDTITENSFDDDWDEKVIKKKNIPYSFVPFSCNSPLKR